MRWPWLAEFDDIEDRLAAGSDRAVEDAIAVLERDDWLFRTGYAKATLFRRLKHVNLSNRQADRLRNVLLHYVDVGPRWEFREVCTFARHVSDRRLRSQLSKRVRGHDDGAALRAVTMIGRIQPTWLDESHKKRAQPLLIDRFTQRSPSPSSVRSARLVRTPGWTEELRLIAAERNDPRCNGADRLLRVLNR